MLAKGWYVVVFNRNHILSTHEDLEMAINACEDHSVGCPRGFYEIFLLDTPTKIGRMGDRIEWK